MPSDTVYGPGAGCTRSDASTTPWNIGSSTKGGAACRRLVKQLQTGPAGNKAGSRVFSRLEDLLAYYGRMAPGRNAILAPGRAPVTYGALWVLVNEAVRELRSLGVGPSDRVAVVLPNGAETAVAIVAVATAAVCVPLNPSFTADEWQRYFGDLQVAALLTRADMDSASRGVAHSPRHTCNRSVAAARRGARRVQPSRLGNAPRRRRRAGAQRRQRRLYPVDLGHHVAAEDGPTDPRERLSVGL